MSAIGSFAVGWRKTPGTHPGILGAGAKSWQQLIDFGSSLGMEAYLTLPYQDERNDNLANDFWTIWVVQ